MNCNLNYIIILVINQNISIKMPAFNKTSTFSHSANPASSSVIAVPLCLPKDALAIICNAKAGEISITSSGENEWTLKVGQVAWLLTQTPTLDAVDLYEEKSSNKFEKISQLTSKFCMSEPFSLAPSCDNTKDSAATLSDSGYSENEPSRESSVDITASSISSQPECSADPLASCSKTVSDAAFMDNISTILANRRNQKKVIQKPGTNHPFFKKLAEGPKPKPEVVVKPMLIVPNPPPSSSSSVATSSVTQSSPVERKCPVNSKMAPQSRISKRSASSPLRTDLKRVKRQPGASQKKPVNFYERSSQASNSYKSGAVAHLPVAGVSIADKKEIQSSYGKIDFSYRIPKYSKLNSSS